MEHKSNSTTKINDFQLFEVYWNNEKTKPKLKCYRDEYKRWQGQAIWFLKNGQFEMISTWKDGELHGKKQLFNEDGTIESIFTNHNKKQIYGTQIWFRYK